MRSSARVAVGLQRQLADALQITITETIIKNDAV